MKENLKELLLGTKLSSGRLDLGAVNKEKHSAQGRIREQSLF